MQSARATNTNAVNECEYLSVAANQSILRCGFSNGGVDCCCCCITEYRIVQTSFPLFVLGFISSVKIAVRFTDNISQMCSFKCWCCDVCLPKCMYNLFCQMINNLRKNIDKFSSITKLYIYLWFVGILCEEWGMTAFVQMWTVWMVHKNTPTHTHDDRHRCVTEASIEWRQ